MIILNASELKSDNSYNPIFEYYYKQSLNNLPQEKTKIDKLKTDMKVLISAVICVILILIIL